MTGPVNRILEALECVTGFAPRPNGKGWSARCPVTARHKRGDKRPSLTIGVGGDGKALLRCFGGCTFAEIMSALDLSEADAMADDNAPMRPRAAPAQRPPEVFAAADDAIAELTRRHGQPVARWDYHDGMGAHVGSVVRWDRADGKRILPVSRHGDTWRIAAMPKPRPLYRLPDLRDALDADPAQLVFVVEGEKCAEALRALGFVATTSAGGSSAARFTDWAPLAGRNIVCLPDNDPAGETYCANVTVLLTALTARPTVRVARLPGLPPGGDIVDYIERRTAEGATAEGVRAEVVKLTEEAPPVSLEAVARESARAPARAPAERADDSAEPDPAASWTPFPVELLPEPMREFVEHEAVALDCDPAFVAVPTLVTAAGAIGLSRWIELKATWREPCIVWAAIVAPSGSMKSPALAEAVAPLRELQERAFAEYDRAVTDYEEASRLYEAAQRKRESLTLAKPVAPARTRFILSDTTMEAIAPILRDNPRGVLLVRDELGGWFRGFDQYRPGGRGGDAAGWCELFHGRAITVDRCTRPTLYVPSGGVSVVGTVQVNTLALLLRPELIEGGLVPRLLLVAPPRRRKRWSEATVLGGVRERYRALIEALTRLQPGDDAPVALPLAADARAGWERSFNANADPLFEAGEVGDECTSGTLAKIEAYLARLSLLVALCDDPDADRVSADAVERGCQFANWFRAETLRVRHLIETGAEGRATAALEKLIRDRGGAITPRELAAASRQYRGQGVAEDALNRLVERKRGCWKYGAIGPTGGGQTRRFVLA